MIWTFGIDITPLFQEWRKDKILDLVQIRTPERMSGERYLLMLGSLPWNFVEEGKFYFGAKSWWYSFVLHK